MWFSVFAITSSLWLGHLAVIKQFYGIKPLIEAKLEVDEESVIVFLPCTVCSSH